MGGWIGWGGCMDKGARNGGEGWLAGLLPPGYCVPSQCIQNGREHIAHHAQQAAHSSSQAAAIGKAEPSYDRSKTCAPFGVGLPLRQLLGGQHDVLTHQRLAAGGRCSEAGWVGGWVGGWGMRRGLHRSMWRHSLHKTVLPSTQLQAASFRNTKLAAN